MKKTTFPIIAISLMTALSSPAATLVDFGGAPTTVSGPGAAAIGGSLVTAFNTISGFGLNAMSGGDRTVMSFSASADNTSGVVFTHASPSPNTTGYTMLMDVYFTSIPNYLSLAQLDNTGDGEIFARGAGANAGNIGIDSDYGTGTGPFSANAWHRMALTVDNSLANSFLNIYVNGSLINSKDPFTNSVDRFDLSDPSFVLFADNDGETAAGYISQFYFDDRAASAQEIAALGSPTTAPIPEPSAALLTLAGLSSFLIRRR